jgi:rubrerythrin
MSEEPFKLDATVIARRTLEATQRGQDLDEALLHVCKELYGDDGVSAFEVFRRLLEAHERGRGVTRAQVLRQFATGNTKEFWRNLPRAKAPGRSERVTSVDELPPELREQARHMRPGEVVVLEHAVTGGAAPEAQTQLPTAPGRFVCAACGFSASEPFDRCPQCGQERPRSFWRRLLGR